MLSPKLIFVAFIHDKITKGDIIQQHIDTQSV